MVIRKFCFFWQLLAVVGDATLQKVCDETANIQGHVCLVEGTEVHNHMECRLTFTEGEFGERVSYVYFHMTVAQFAALADLNDTPLPEGPVLRYTGGEEGELNG